MSILERIRHWFGSRKEATVAETTAVDSREDGDAPSPERRQFLGKLIIALGGIAAAIAGVPVVGFLLGPVVQEEPDVWRPVGEVNDFPVGETVAVEVLDPGALPWAGFAAETGLWLRRQSEAEFIVFSAYCTHVGCPVRWVPDANFFMCPCHGGVFYSDGTVASGPPPRPLERHAVRVREGIVEVATRPIPLPE